MNDQRAALALIAMSTGFGLAGIGALALGAWQPTVPVAIAFASVALGIVHGARVHARGRAGR